MNFYETFDRFVKGREFWLFLLLILLSRMPRFLDPHFYMGGDEGILGLQVLHLIKHGAIPGFFYGQSYGLVTIEVLTIAPFVALFGPSALTLKLPFLLLFAAGLFYMFRFLKLMVNRKTAFLISLLFVFLPAWYLMSMRGYLSAFFVFNLFLFHLALYLKKGRGFSLGLMGFLLYYIFMAHPLWLAGAVPLLLLVFNKEQWMRKVLAFLSGIAISVMICWLLTLRENQEYWNKPETQWSINWEVIGDVARATPDTWSGTYFLDSSLDNGVISHWFGLLTAAGSLLVLILGIIRLAKNSKLEKLLLLGFLLSLVQLLVIKFWGSRYLLPTVELTFLLLALQLKKVDVKQYKNYLYGFAMIVAILASLSLRSMKVGWDGGIDYNDQKTLGELIEGIESHGVHHAYCFDPLMQWQVSYLSDENIICRWIDPVDRIPSYPKAIDSVQLSSGQTALFGYAFDPRFDELSQFTEVYTINGVYSYVLFPGTPWLRSHGFEINQ